MPKKMQRKPPASRARPGRAKRRVYRAPAGSRELAEKIARQVKRDFRGNIEAAAMAYGVSVRTLRGLLRAVEEGLPLRNWIRSRSSFERWEEIYRGIRKTFRAVRKFERERARVEASPQVRAAAVPKAEEGEEERAVAAVEKQLDEKGFGMVDLGPGVVVVSPSPPAGPERRRRVRFTDLPQAMAYTRDLLKSGVPSSYIVIAREPGGFSTFIREKDRPRRRRSRRKR